MFSCSNSLIVVNNSFDRKFWLIFYRNKFFKLLLLKQFLGCSFLGCYSVLYFFVILIFSSCFKVVSVSLTFFVFSVLSCHNMPLSCFIKARDMLKVGIPVINKVSVKISYGWLKCDF